MVADGQNLVVDVEAGGAGGGAARHPGHQQAAVDGAGDGPDPARFVVRFGGVAEGQPQPVEGFRVVELAGRVEGVREPVRQRFAGRRLRLGPEFVRREPALPRVAGVGAAQHVVETRRPARGRAYAHVEQEADHRALGVVADRRVLRILVGAVELDPRVPRRQRHRLHGPPRRGLQAADLAGQRLQILGFGGDPRPVHREVGVVAGQPFDDPQALGVDLGLVVERPELDGPQALPVPGVEQLVADEAEPAQVARPRRRRPAAGHEQRRVAVLEPAAGFGDQVEEHVALVGQQPPHAMQFAGDAFRVFRRPRPVPGPRFADVDELVGHARHPESVDGRVAGDDRRVDQGVEVAGAPGAGRAAGVRRQGRGGAAPGRRQLQEHVVGAGTVVVGEGEERRRAVQHREVGVDPVRPHRHLAPVDPVGDHDGVGAPGGRPPAVLPRLFDPQPPAVRGAGGDGFDVAGVLADQVRPGRPHRHHQLHFGPPAGRDPGFDVDVVGVRCGEPQRVGDGFARLGERRLGRRRQDRREQESARASTVRSCCRHGFYSESSRAATAAPSRAGRSSRITRTGICASRARMGGLSAKASMKPLDRRAGSRRGAMPPPT